MVVPSHGTIKSITCGQNNVDSAVPVKMSYTLVNMIKRLGIFLLLFVLAGLIFASSAYAAFYPFGGRIGFVSYAAPLGLCGPFIPYIIVAGPKPGVFIIPPVKSYLFYQWQRVGPKVLGLATSPFCGIITSIGTSLY